MDGIVIGKRLKALRGTKTLEEVGNDLNVTAMAVSLWERGERIPNDDLKIKISNYFGVPLVDIFFAE